MEKGSIIIDLTVKDPLELQSVKNIISDDMDAKMKEAESLQKQYREERKDLKTDYIKQMYKNKMIEAQIAKV